MIPTASQMSKVKLESLDKVAALYLDALLRDQKVGTFPSAVATVGTTSTLVLATQAGRVFSQIINISDADVDLAFGEAAVYGQGARLISNGGVYTIDWENMWKAAVYAIAPGANKNLSTIDGRIS